MQLHTVLCSLPDRHVILPRVDSGADIQLSTDRQRQKSGSFMLCQLSADVSQNKPFKDTEIASLCKIQNGEGSLCGSLWDGMIRKASQ